MFYGLQVHCVCAHAPTAARAEWRNPPPQRGRPTLDSDSFLTTSWILRTIDVRKIYSIRKLSSGREKRDGNLPPPDRHQGRQGPAADSATPIETRQNTKSPQQLERRGQNETNDNPDTEQPPPRKRSTGGGDVISRQLKNGGLQRRGATAYRSSNSQKSGIPRQWARKRGGDLGRLLIRKVSEAHALHPEPNDPRTRYEMMPLRLACGSRRGKSALPPRLLIIMARQGSLPGGVSPSETRRHCSKRAAPNYASPVQPARRAGGPRNQWMLKRRPSSSAHQIGTARFDYSVEAQRAVQ